MKYEEKKEIKRERWKKRKKHLAKNHLSLGGRITKKIG
jgi:hypothetical protein